MTDEKVCEPIGDLRFWLFCHKIVVVSCGRWWSSSRKIFSECEPSKDASKYPEKFLGTFFVKSMTEFDSFLQQPILNFHCN